MIRLFNFTRTQKKRRVGVFVYLGMKEGGGGVYMCLQLARLQGGLYSWVVM